MVEQVLQRFGTIDILVNNAGATWGAPAEEYPDHAWRKVMGLNVDAIFFLAREVARRTSEGVFVMVFPDGGDRYLSSGLYRRKF